MIESMPSPDVRTAKPADLSNVLSILEMALLDVSLETVRARIEADTVLVAVAADRMLGACVINPRDEGAVVEAIAVRPNRRGQTIGSMLLDAASDTYSPLIAEFDAAVKPFYESLDFTIEPLTENRYRGQR